MNLEERKDWLKWRHNAITASDASCLYNKNPYKTLQKLYEEKIQEEPPAESDSNVAMKRGVELEPILREKFCAYFKENFNVEDSFSAKNCTHSKHDFIKASLDGCSLDGLTLVEIKFVGEKVFAQGVCPHHYWIQIQHQFLASGALNGYLIMGTDEHTFKVLEIKRDDEFIAAHLDICTQFWDDIQERRSPIPVVKDNRALELANEYKKLKHLIEGLEIQLQDLKKEILEFVEDREEIRVGELNIKKITSKGLVDYSKIEILNGLDLEPYRKISRVSYKITSIGE